MISIVLSIYLWFQRIDLGQEGVMPLEIRFLHNPKATEGFVGCALFGKVFRFYKTKKGDWAAEKVRNNQVIVNNIAKPNC